MVQRSGLGFLLRGIICYEDPNLLTGKFGPVVSAAIQGERDGRMLPMRGCCLGSLTEEPEMEQTVIENWSARHFNHPVTEQNVY